MGRSIPDQDLKPVGVPISSSEWFVFLNVLSTTSDRDAFTNHVASSGMYLIKMCGLGRTLHVLQLHVLPEWRRSVTSYNHSEVVLFAHVICNLRSNTEHCRVWVFAFNNPCPDHSNFRDVGGLGNTDHAFFTAFSGISPTDLWRLLPSTSPDRQFADLYIGSMSWTFFWYGVYLWNIGLKAQRKFDECLKLIIRLIKLFQKKNSLF